MKTEVVRDQKRLDTLAEEWDDLYARCPAATPFQTHAWNAAWARAYCPRDRLRVVVVRSSDRMVAVAPFFLGRRGPWSTLMPLGGAITDYFDLLLPEPDGEAGHALRQALLDEDGWRLVELPELRPESAALAWGCHWPGHVARLDDSPSLEFPAASLSDVAARIPGRTGNLIRRKVRKLEAAEVVARPVPTERLPEALADLLRLHDQQWRGRPINPEHLTPRYAAFLSEAFQRLVGAGHAVVVEYSLGGELVAGEVDLIGPRFVGYYLAGISPELRQHIDVTSMLIRHGLELARSTDRERYSMLRGHEEFKRRWNPEVVSNSRLLLSRPGPLGGLGYPTGVRGRAAALLFVRHRLPWLRDLKNRAARARARAGQRAERGGSVGPPVQAAAVQQPHERTKDPGQRSD